MTARTTLAVQPIIRGGLTPVYVAVDATNMNDFPNDGRTFVHVKNGHSAPIVLTIGTPGSVDGLAVAERTVSITNAEERMIGPFPTNTYNQSNGRVNLDWALGTSMTVAVLRL